MRQIDWRWVLLRVFIAVQLLIPTLALIARAITGQQVGVGGWQMYS